MMDHPICFVLMPFGTKSDDFGHPVEFDTIYTDVIRPAIEAAQMKSIRADEERTGGVIHKPMFERLILCKFAVADLTTANANVFYELGIRHAVRPWSTISIFHEASRLPFDVGLLRAIPYSLSEDGRPSDPREMKQTITERLRKARRDAVESAQGPLDSPLYQLLDGYPEIDRERTDVFRKRVSYATDIKRRLEEARSDSAEAIRNVESDLGNIQDTEAGVVIDLLLSYRAVKAYNDMIRLFHEMSMPLQSTLLVREQYAFALNRNARRSEAERVLTELIDDRGPSSETLGLLGRVYKDQWEEARNAGKLSQSAAYLRRATDAYRRGFEANWKDAYPGINAVTLMEIAEPPDPERRRLLPVVTYAAERRVNNRTPDYWDYATLLEAAVLQSEPNRATDTLGDALTRAEEPWQPETTARNLRLIRSARERRGVETAWIQELESNLLAASAALDPSTPEPS